MKTIVHGNAGSTAASDTDTTYTFNYGLFGALIQIKAGDPYPNQPQLSDTTNTQYNLASSSYGNGGRIDYIYDRYGNLTEKKYDGDSSDKVKYRYDAEGGLAVREDDLNNIRTKLLYDLSGRLIGIVNSGSRDHKISYGYNEENNVSGVTSRVEGISTTGSYTYDRDSRLTASEEGSVREEVTYDVYGRTSGQTIKNGTTTVLTQSIGYVNPDNSHTSLLPESITNTIAVGNIISYSYTYDSKGNITSVTDSGGNATSYSYDGLSQLIRENNREAGKTWTYTYDSAGNIREKKEYAYTVGSLGTPTDTTTFSYDDATWKDILTGVNGTTYTTDAIGNLTSDGEWTYTWQHGRQLAGMNKPGTDIVFTYDAEGIRLSKTVTEGSSTTEYKYYYQDGNLTDVIWGSNRFHIFYDGNGSPVSFTYGGITYYYVKNLQGDITAITNASGSIVTKYSYDAWGNPISTTESQATTIGVINPLRYRGYVWDDESGWYYLENRYYYSLIHRFCSSDDIANLGSDARADAHNLFTYCNNNPINYVDTDGNFPGIASALIGGAVAGGLLSGFSFVINSAIEGKTPSTCEVVTAIALGAVDGMIGAGIGTLDIVPRLYYASLYAMATASFKGKELDEPQRNKVQLSNIITTVASIGLGGAVSCPKNLHVVLSSFANTCLNLTIGTPLEMANSAVAICCKGQNSKSTDNRSASQNKQVNKASVSITTTNTVPKYPNNRYAGNTIPYGRSR